MRICDKGFRAVPGLRETLANPMVGRSDKSALLVNAAGGDVDESFRRFVTLVLENGRETLFHDIALSYMEVYRRAHNIAVVTLVSVEPMSELMLERVRLDVERRIHGRVELETRTDPSLQGGFIFQVGDLRLDASISGQLERIRQQFIKKNRVIV